MTPIEIDVWQGNIAELEVDALVVSATESLFMTSAQASELKRRAGEEVERAAVSQGPIVAGSAIATSAGRLAASYIIHAVAVGHDLRADPEQLRSALRAALDFARPLHLRRMAVACLGIERGAFTPEEAAPILVNELHARTAETDLPESVVFATSSPAETRAFVAALERARVEAR